METLFDRSAGGENLGDSVMLTAIFTTALLGAISMALNQLVRRSYLITSAVGWVCFLTWLVFDMIQDAAMIGLAMPVKDSLIGTSAILFASASLKCRGIRVASIDLALMSLFIFAWSLAANVSLRDRLQVEAPLFSLLALTAFWTSWSFLVLKTPKRRHGTTILMLGFILWGLFLMVHPYINRWHPLHREVLLILCIGQSCLIVGMVVLVIEDAIDQKNAFKRKLASTVHERRLLRFEVDDVESYLREWEDSGQGITRAADRMGSRVRFAQLEHSARTTSSALRNLAGSLAHFFNNRLTPVVALSELGVMSKGGLGENDMDNIDALRTSALEIVDVVRKFGMFASSTPPLLDGEIVSVGCLLAELRAGSNRYLETKNETKRVEITMVSGETLELGVMTDDLSALNTALLAIVENALEASGIGRSELVTIACSSSDDGWIIMKFQDAGIGMDAATIDQCRLPFFTTKHPNASSPGLGLAVCDTVIRRHGGHIRVSSILGEGTAVDIVLPIALRKNSKSTVSFVSRQRLSE